MSDVVKYNKWVSNLFRKVFPGSTYDYKDKEANANIHMAYMLDRTQSMFQYDGLPDSIPQCILELYLQVAGCCCFHEVNGELYVFTGGLGGEPDVYYRPTIFTVANPALNYSRNLKIDEDCIVISNDSLYLGLIPLFSKYATQMAENELSIYIAIINSRIFDLISASDDATKASAELFLKRIADGELGVIAESAFLDGIKAQPYGSTGRANQITQLIENQQYLKAAWFNDLGLNANYNMKREALSTAESQLNDDALLPLVDDMLRCREQGLEKVNEKYGLNITVKFASSWEDNMIELEKEQQEIEEPEEKPEEKKEEVKEDETTD